uniref:Uncharacterized protein n=1 Tax=Knipowitschia caucasica TaxID=637954 RepID=A0AAV2JFT6_KNICA
MGGNLVGFWGVDLGEGGWGGGIWILFGGLGCVCLFVVWVGGWGFGWFVWSRWGVVGGGGGGLFCWGGGVFFVWGGGCVGGVFVGFWWFFMLWLGGCGVLLGFWGVGGGGGRRIWGVWWWVGLFGGFGGCLRYLGCGGVFVVNYLGEMGGFLCWGGREFMGWGWVGIWVL